MKEKDFEVVKIMADLSLIEDKPLTDEQELMLKRALDPNEQYLHDIECLFSKKTG